MTLRLIDRILDLICGHHDGPPPEPVNIADKLDAMAHATNQELDWRHSIVDLMKLLGLDSSLEHRQQLAAELGFPGDKQNIVAMNVWLHREVMRRLADNGGVVPSDLR